MRRWRLVVMALVVLLVYPAAQTPGQGGRRPASSGPTLRLGALLPVTGAGAWFGAEIKQGLDLAAMELDPAPPTSTPLVGGGGPESPVSPPGGGGTDVGSPAPFSRGGGTGTGSGPFAPGRYGAGESGTDVGSPAPLSRGGRTGTGSGPFAPGRYGESDAPPTSREAPKIPGSPKTSGYPKTSSLLRTEPVEPPGRPRKLTLVVDAFDVQPLDLRAAEAETNRLLGSDVTAIVTASPTPTLTAHSLAAARDVLVIHAGLATDRFPPSSRNLLQLRPSVAARADVLGAHAWQRGLRRLAVVAGGDAFGRGLRAAVTERWRQNGGHLSHDENVSLDAPDLKARLRPIARTAPEATVLGFQGVALGEAARALREAGYTGLLLAVDDDRAALLAGGRALDGALILSDAFIPVSGSRGARFARAYEARHGEPPSRFAANAYEAAILLADAANRVLGEGRTLSGSRLRQALAAAQHPSLYAGELVIRDDGTVARPLALFRVDQSRLTFESYVGVDGRALAAPAGNTP
jgi:ABC-type branched-subunit amino acid transport system substrate-binding protein